MRLIDADRYKKKWMKTRTFEPMKLLDLQPTAYDIDKVVNGLEEAKHEICLSDDDLEHYQNGIDKAIEIVKQGCADDDVCEWKLTDTRKLMPYKTSCGNEDLYDSHYKYCPYCGKKIKVVE